MDIQPRTTNLQATSTNKNQQIDSRSLSYSEAPKKDSVTFSGAAKRNSRFQSGWNLTKQNWPMLLGATVGTGILCLFMPALIPALPLAPLAVGSVIFIGGAIRNTD